MSVRVPERRMPYKVKVLRVEGGSKLYADFEEEDTVICLASEESEAQWVCRNSSEDTYGGVF